MAGQLSLVRVFPRVSVLSLLPALFLRQQTSTRMPSWGVWLSLYAHHCLGQFCPSLFRTAHLRLSKWMILSTLRSPSVDFAFSGFSSPKNIPLTSRHWLYPLNRSLSYCKCSVTMRAIYMHIFRPPSFADLTTLFSSVSASRLCISALQASRGRIYILSDACPERVVSYASGRDSK